MNNIIEIDNSIILHSTFDTSEEFEVTRVIAFIKLNKIYLDIDIKFIIDDIYNGWNYIEYIKKENKIIIKYRIDKINTEKKVLWWINKFKHLGEVKILRQGQKQIYN
jgi:hypothetical protein